MTVDCIDGSAYYIWDNDNNRGNNIPRMTQGILTMRERCAAKGLKALRILNYKQVDSLRVLLQRKGYNLRRGSGVALGMDYAMKNSYQALDDASVDVSDVLKAMTRGSYSGDHHTDQTGGKQHLAGFGWGRSTQDAGIEDWGF
eukprot:COSAG01_NODE_16894_length_1195_cov_2.024635_2_plen_142_part_01